MLGAIAFVSALACAGLDIAPAAAQPTNNDYYKSEGTELLRNVERYHVGLAIDKLRTRQFESAAADIGFILNYFPNHPQGLALQMQLCEQQKSSGCAPERMTEVFERAIAVNPDVAATYVAQGIYLYRVKQLPAAIASLEKATTLDPDSLNAQYNLGLVYFESKKYEQANAHAQRAYQLGATMPGLRDKLKKAGQWKPLAPSPPDVAPSASSEPGSTGAAR